MIDSPIRPVILPSIRDDLAQRWPRGDAPPAPPAVDNLLLESGDDLLLESGDLILLE